MDDDHGYFDHAVNEPSRAKQQGKSKSVGLTDRRSALTANYYGAFEKAASAAGRNRRDRYHVIST
jgi:hypothetical protein